MRLNLVSYVATVAVVSGSTTELDELISSSVANQVTNLFSQARRYAQNQATAAQTGLIANGTEVFEEKQRKVLFNGITAAKGSFIFGICTTWILPGTLNGSFYLYQRGGLPYSAKPHNYTYATSYDGACLEYNESTPRVNPELGVTSRIDGRCMVYESVNERGKPDELLWTNTYDPRGKAWFLKALSLDAGHGGIATPSSNAAGWAYPPWVYSEGAFLGLAVVQPMYIPARQQMAGISVIFITLDTIDAYLVSTYKDSPGLLVYVIDDDTGKLIAASQDGVALSVVNGGSPTQTVGASSSNSDVAFVETFFASTSSFEGKIFGLSLPERGLSWVLSTDITDTDGSSSWDGSWRVVTIQSVDCDAGYFTSVDGETDLSSGRCEACVWPAWSSGGGITFCDTCVSDYFLSTTLTSSADVCTPCLSGVSCSAGLTSTATLNLDAGYWRASSYSTDVRKCPGGKSACHGGTDVSGYCEEGYAGPLCASCKARTHYPDPSDTSLCVACKDDERSFLGLSHIGQVIFYLSLFVFCVCFCPLGLWLLWRTLPSHVTAGVHLHLTRLLRVLAKSPLLANVDVDYSRALRVSVGSKAEEDGAVSTGVGPLVVSAHKTETLPPVVSRRKQTHVTPFERVDTTRTVQRVSTVTTTVVTTVSSSNSSRALVKAAKDAQIQFKSLIAYFQIAANVPFNSNTAFPSAFAAVLDWFSPINFDGWGKLTCSLPRWDFVDQMAMATLVPLALAALLFLVFVALGAILFHRPSSDLAEKYRYLSSGGASAEADAALSSLSEHDLAGARRTFAHYDNDDSGTIDFAELAKVIRESHPDATDEDIQHLFSEKDVDFDGVISFSEFALMFRRAKADTGVPSKRLSTRNVFEALENKVALKLKQGQTIAYLGLLLTFLVLIGSSTRLFQFFTCDSFKEVVAADGSTKTLNYLSQDYSVSCDSERYKAMKVYAGFMVCIFPVGTPALYTALLWRHRDILKSEEVMLLEREQNFPTVGHLAFLTHSYMPKFWWYEVFECARRLLLGSIIGVISDNAAITASIAVVVCLASSSILVRLDIYRNRHSEAVAVLLFYSLTVIFLSALMLNANIGTDTRDDETIFGVCLILVLFAGPVGISVHAVLAVHAMYHPESNTSGPEADEERNKGTEHEEGTDMLNGGAGDAGPEWMVVVENTSREAHTLQEQDKAVADTLIEDDVEPKVERARGLSLDDQPELIETKDDGAS